MIITTVSVQSHEGEPKDWFLASDLHLGSINSDLQKIKEQFDIALKYGADILINGDVFDCIGHGDKRYMPGILSGNLANEADLTSGIVALGELVLLPYVKNIRVIGIGNHEESWIKYCKVDPVRLLIDRLNSKGGHIVHGSFWGYIKTDFRVERHGKVHKSTHRLLYFHGAGGDSPITKGTVDFARKASEFDFDALTFGHKHNLLASVDQVGTMTNKGCYKERRRLSLQTGSYFQNYKGLKKGEELAYSYAAQRAHPPKPIGGLFLTLIPSFDSNDELEIKQDFSTTLISRSPQECRTELEVT